MSLVTAWTELGRRAAVIAGTGVALVALIQHCPVWVASVRGAGALLAVALLAHVVGRLLAWTSAGDREEARARLATVSQPALADKVLGKSGGPRG